MYRQLLYHLINLYSLFETTGHLTFRCNHVISFLYRTLAQFLQKQMAQNKPLPEKDVLTMFSQMVDALKYLHDHNILHRSRSYTSHACTHVDKHMHCIHTKHQYRFFIDTHTHTHTHNIKIDCCFICMTRHFSNTIISF